MLFRSLASSGDRTVAAFVQTTNTDLTNRTDVFVKPVAAVTAANAGALRAEAAPPLRFDPEWVGRSNAAAEFQLDLRGAEWRKARAR